VEVKEIGTATYQTFVSEDGSHLKGYKTARRKETGNHHLIIPSICSYGL